MRRAGRRVLNGVTVLLAVLALTAAVESVRSFWRTDGLVISDGAEASSLTGFETARGGITMLHVQVGFRERRLFSFYGRSQLSYYPPLLSRWGPPHRHSFAGFGFCWNRDYFGDVEQAWTAPLPFLSLLFAVLPAVRFRAYVRHRRLSRVGLCAGCGYDLTGNVSGVCPECGTKTSA